MERITSFYAKEITTIDRKVVYHNSEVELAGIPPHIKSVIPDAIKITGEGFSEYVSRSIIKSIEVYIPKEEK